MNEKVEELKTSLGALSEMTRLFYENLVNQGFDETQSLYLTAQMIRSTFNAGIEGG